MSADAQQLLALQQQMADLTAELHLVETTTLSQESADTFWQIFTGALVFFMQCGFGMLEAGAVASKSTQSIMMKNLFDAAIAGVLWWLVGYGLMNEEGGFFGITPKDNRTYSHYASHELMVGGAETSGKDWANIFFQFTFAAAAATIVSGAVAERAQLPAYLIFSSLITGFVYPIVAHWVWSSTGWLSWTNPDSRLKLLDFAGSGVVHMTGGLAALVGAKVIGPRTGRFDGSGHAVPMPGHSSVLQVLGTFILWLGWYGFNAGSTLTITTESARSAGRIVVTTTLSAAAGGISAVSLEKLLGVRRTWDVAAMGNGILAGLVSITAGCASVQPWAAVIIGIGGACCYRLASRLMLRSLIDDPLDAFAVHGACGYWGIISSSLFSATEYVRFITSGRVAYGGLFYGDARLLGAASVFVVAHTAWVGTLSIIIFLTLKKLAILRVPKHVEIATMGSGGKEEDDASTHGGQPYWPPGATAPPAPPSPELNGGAATTVVVEPVANGA